MKNKIRVAFIGCGNMAQAIIKSMNNPSVRAALKSEKYALEITASDCDERNLMNVRGMCEVTSDNSAAVATADYVFIAVKPQNAEAALIGLELSHKVVVSIMAGVSIAALKSITGASKIVRVMPNLNARVGESLNAYCAEGLSDDELHTVSVLFGCFGTELNVKESELDAVTGLSGSGPAFVFMTLKAFRDEAVARGFDEETAKRIAVQTVIGSALTAEKSDDIDALIESVCSKGGTTAEGVSYLCENKYEGILRGAIVKAIEKSKEMSV